MTSASSLSTHCAPATKSLVLQIHVDAEYTSHGSKWLLSTLHSSTFLEVNSTGDKVHQTTEVKELKDAHECSIYAKGFLEDKDAALQQCLEVFFNTYSTINSVRMQRDKKKKFKASVLAEFADFEMVDKFLKAEPKPTFKGKELQGRLL
ncbi:hypothetical protein EST38_g12663 [Candolleomyces aberdarensis]|uniref:RRM domain-containing protein n=1 Tax=Candolleomyces aberdarensis TaxID=2316362 RepID=A0A4Q2D2M2_9AGAR|nr:hypothetical protein EST38_g12663 [Candolleomyces aberdarensis]